MSGQRQIILRPCGSVKELRQKHRDYRGDPQALTDTARTSFFGPSASLGAGFGAKQSQFDPHWTEESLAGGQEWARAAGQERAKQSQFRPERNEGQVLYRKRVMTSGTGRRLQQNKAILPRTDQKRLRRAAAGVRPRQEASMRNKANSARTAVGSGGQDRCRPRQEVLCETKPIGPEQDERQVLYGKRVTTSAPWAASGKQSQFPGSGWFYLPIHGPLVPRRRSTTPSMGSKVTCRTL